MSTTDAEIEELPPRSTVASFAIEADHPRNCDLLIQNIPGRLRLRSRVLSSRTIETETGPAVPRDQVSSLAGLPDVPGMVIAVKPSDCTVLIQDPLNDAEHESTRARLLAFLKNANMFNGESIKGVEERQETLTKHQMKTLCREMFWLLDAGEARIYKGTPAPEMSDIEAMPGEFLLNPGATIPNSQPRYEKDYEEWVDSLGRLGG
jgi:hypothetical protein